MNGKDSHGHYRVKLFSDAVAASKKMTFVGSQMNGPTTVSSMPFPKSHEGWSGYTIVQIQGKAANDVTAAPNIILLHAGTNDTYCKVPSVSGPPAPLDVRRLSHHQLPERADRRGEDHSLSLAGGQHEPHQQQRRGHGSIEGLGGQARHRWRT